MSSQPLPTFNPSQNYWEVLGVPEKILIDAEILQNRFYTLSRKFHPDRFMQASADQKQLSQEWSAQLNEAYNTLKDFYATIEYLLKTKNVPETGKNQMPMELSEAFFEIQELLEDRTGNQVAISKMEKDLEERMLQNENQLKTLAKQWDESPAPETLKNIREKFDLYRYIRSMQRNLMKVGTHG
jgi:molecular chaperone HscB